MMPRLLFRQYDYPNELISGTKGSKVIAGIGTHFTSLPIGTTIHLEYEGEFFVLGRIDTISGDTSLTLDSKVKFDFSLKNYWIDWTMFMLSMDGLNRKVESDNFGEAGAITYDSCEINTYVGDLLNSIMGVASNPIKTAFAGSIDEKKRFL